MSDATFDKNLFGADYELDIRRNMEEQDKEDNDEEDDG